MPDDQESELDLLLHLTEIECLNSGSVTGNATGFFFLRDKYLFLITNRHVVVGTGAGQPDQLRITLHESADELTKTTSYLIPIQRGVEKDWFEYTDGGDEDPIDVVAIPLTDPTLVEKFEFRSFGPDDLLADSDSLRLGSQLLLLGFPLGFHDEVHHLPVARTAFVATAYAVPFQRTPTFLTDGRMHRGASGSPAIVKRPGQSGSVEYKVAGVHSAAYDMASRDPSQDDRLALNTVWRAYLIEKLTADASRKWAEGADVRTAAEPDSDSKPQPASAS
ncbi:trypsin-like peptidase domain-containing protein [Stratiformator vulcanicus]|uniref:Trypsin n=1 Tax=Stratiformator vulcanicus TaxID=2527980 RepID=A0A517R2Y8_9PLAN|nr:trypsin-like peptidase domain-containing protein [Stratiformator vulcanicus]QDT38245.1 hypothetical protein Pan189_26350 [Stratiformator vulcanicus]